jgi:L-ascorbate metabolism protein UlaG (beta-lactamase superfamily)
MRAVVALLVVVLATPLVAQERTPSDCVLLAEAPTGPERPWPAGFRDPLPEDAVRISFVDHAMLLIQAGGVSAVTDFDGHLGMTDLLPDVVTMNQGHSGHWTPSPDPAIPHALRGWTDTGEPASHRLDLGAMLVRNVPTDLRAPGGGMEADGNSIFVFEAAGLCIGHLGHLHHEPTPEDYGLLGRLDVVMVPVDGGLTLDHPTLMRTLDRLRSRVVIPMHWWGQGTLDAFLDGLSDDFAVRREGESELVLTRDALPDRPTVWVLEPRRLSD